MTYFEKPETTEEALAHYGVLGMRWGHHKAPTPQSSEYSDGNRRYDAARFGTKGVQRINDRMVSGMDIASARKAEVRHRRNKRLMIIGATYAAMMLYTHGPTLAQSLSNNYVAKKNAANGARAAANLLADSKGIGNHKIVDLGFDAVTGVWG